MKRYSKALQAYHEALQGIRKTFKKEEAEAIIAALEALRRLMQERLEDWALRIESEIIRKIREDLSKGNL